MGSTRVIAGTGTWKRSSAVSARRPHLPPAPAASRPPRPPAARPLRTRILKTYAYRSHRHTFGVPPPPSCGRRKSGALFHKGRGVPGSGSWGALPPGRPRLRSRRPRSLPPPSPAPAALTHRHGSAHCLAISSRRRWHGALGTGGCESACLGACVCGACVRESAPSSPGSRSFLLSSLPNDTDSGDLGSCFH